MIGIDAEQNQVIVGEKEFLSRDSFELHRCLWNVETPQEPIRVECRIRYRHQPVPATVHPLDDGGARIDFDQPQKGITPGQAAVFYLGDRVIGGGWIA